MFPFPFVYVFYFFLKKVDKKVDKWSNRVIDASKVEQHGRSYSPALYGASQDQSNRKVDPSSTSRSRSSGLDSKNRKNTTKNAKTPATEVVTRVIVGYWLETLPITPVPSPSGRCGPEVCGEFWVLLLNGTRQVNMDR